MCIAFGALVTKSRLPMTFLELFDLLFTSFVKSHEKVIEMQRKKEEEEAQTFKYKTREIKIETEEEKEARRLKELFPEFEGDFADLIEEAHEDEDEAGADDRDETQPKEPVPEEPAQKEAKHRDLTPSALFQLCQVHKLIFSLFSHQVAPLPVSNTTRTRNESFFFRYESVTHHA